MLILIISIYSILILLCLFPAHGLKSRFGSSRHGSRSSRSIAERIFIWFQIIFAGRYFENNGHNGRYFENNGRYFYGRYFGDILHITLTLALWAKYRHGHSRYRYIAAVILNHAPAMLTCFYSLSLIYFIFFFRCLLYVYSFSVSQTSERFSFLQKPIEQSMFSFGEISAVRDLSLALSLSKLRSKVLTNDNSHQKNTNIT